MIEFKDVFYTVGGRVLLERASFSLAEGDRCGLIGPNGSGKTTILRILIGQLRPDAGEVQIQRGRHLGYLAQTPEFAPGEMVWKHVAEDPPQIAGVLEQIRQTEARMEREEDPARLDRLVEQHRTLDRELEARGGFEVEGRAEAVLDGLGIPRALFDREIRTLSGGEKNRVALARILVQAPDILVLDEPTNYLDIEMVEWLEDWLSGLSRTILFSSHDRYFLNRIARSCLEIRGAALHWYRGNYDAYAVQREEEIDFELKRYEREQGEVARDLEFIRRNFYGQRARQAKSREKRVARIESSMAPPPESGPAIPRIRFSEVQRGGDDVLTLEEVSCGFEGRILMEGVRLSLERGERAAILGRNGCGKTTILKTMAGSMAPRSGTIKTGVRTVPGLYDQECAAGGSPRSVFDEVHDLVPRWNNQDVRDLLAAFLFRGDRILIPVDRLSGGEKAKMALIRLILSGANLLLLDEPTNHLDLHSRTALEEALQEFPETVVFISHDRYFIERLADRIFLIEDGRLREVIGGWPAYREALRLKRKGEEDARRRERDDRSRAARKKAAAARPPGGRKKVDEGKLLVQIEGLEAELRERHEEASRPEVLRSADASRRLKQEIADLQERIADLYRRWETHLG